MRLGDLSGPRIILARLDSISSDLSAFQSARARRETDKSNPGNAVWWRAELVEAPFDRLRAHVVVGSGLMWLSAQGSCGCRLRAHVVVGSGRQHLRGLTFASADAGRA
jgi:hypothetical protein